jgi:GlpG protein
MRSLGYIDGRKATEQFVAFLLTRNIKTHIETAEGDRWELWVRNEDQLGEALKELASFQENPHDPRYQAAVKEASRLLEEDRKSRQAAERNVRRFRPSAQVGLASGPIPPLTMTLMVLCIVVTLVSDFARPSVNNQWGQAIVHELTFVDREAYAKSGDPAASLKRGEIWRTITPIFMHGNAFHLAMNLFAMLVLVAAVIPNLMQGLAPAWLKGSPDFVGISGVVYALFGYIWIRSTLNPELGIVVPMPIVVLMVGMIVLGFTVDIPTWNFADMCHLGGLLVGVGLAYASSNR